MHNQSRFLPNAGKYMLNVLNGESNGAEKDEAWCWKSGADWEVVRQKMVLEKRELRDLEGKTSPLLGQAKL